MSTATRLVSNCRLASVIVDFDWSGAAGSSRRIYAGSLLLQSAIYQVGGGRLPSCELERKASIKEPFRSHPAAFQNEFRIGFHKYRSDFDHPLGRRYSPRVFGAHVAMLP